MNSGEVVKARDLRTVGAAWAAYSMFEIALEANSKSLLRDFGEGGVRSSKEERRGEAKEGREESVAARMRRLGRARGMTSWCHPSIPVTFLLRSILR